MSRRSHEIIERNRALYREDPEGFIRETKRRLRAVPSRPEPPEIYEWEDDVDPRERDAVMRRSLLDKIEQMDASDGRPRADA